MLLTLCRRVTEKKKKCVMEIFAIFYFVLCLSFTLRTYYWFYSKYFCYCFSMAFSNRSVIHIRYLDIYHSLLNRKNKIKSLRILFAYLIFVRIYNFDVTCTDLVQEMGCKATNLNVECVREPVRCFFFFSNSILWRFFNNVSRSVWSMWESSSLYLTKWLLDIKKSILKLVYSQTVEKSNDFALNLPVLFDFDYIVWSWKLNASVSNQNR